MVRALFIKWPHLKKQLSLEDDALIICKEKLRTYFKNSRKLQFTDPGVCQIFCQFFQMGKMRKL